MDIRGFDLVRIGEAEAARDAVFGKVGTPVSFGVGHADARFLAGQFAPTLMADELMNLDRYHMAVHLMVDGTPTAGFTAEGLPPVQERTGARETVIAASRARYAREAAVVDQMIRTWSERVYRPPRWPEREARSSPEGMLSRASLLDETAEPVTAVLPAPAADQMGASGS